MRNSSKKVLRVNNEKDHICPDEVTLAEYMTGTLGADRKESTDKHVSECMNCMYRLSEAYEILNVSKLKIAKEYIMKNIKKINIYLVLSIFTFIFSFIFRKFFIQFLAASVVLALKWIIDNKNTRILIMIHEAWKNGGEKEAGKILKNIEKKDRF